MKPILLCLICFASLFASAKKKHNSQNLTGTYTLSKQFNRGQLLPVKKVQTKISIDQTNHTILCNVGCNTISGAFTATRNKIEPLQLISTEMSCGNLLDQLEATFAENLRKVNRYRLVNTNLILLEDEVILIVLKRK